MVGAEQYFAEPSVDHANYLISLYFFVIVFHSVSLLIIGQTKKPSTPKGLSFGSSAILVFEDPQLSVPLLRRVWLYRELLRYKHGPEELSMSSNGYITDWLY
jgi:hypothetical protein